MTQTLFTPRGTDLCTVASPRESKVYTSMQLANMVLNTPTCYDDVVQQ